MGISSVRIELEKDSYDVLIGNNFLERKLFKDLVVNREVMLVYDKNLDSAEIKDTQSAYLNLGATVSVSVGIEATEENKSYRSLNEIQNLLIENEFSRDCLLVGFGGGIICDLTGFAAATFLRGVDFILIPTSLLAQVDASVGGKTAINHPKGKNLIGSFHQPKRVFIETAYLSTLPEREIRSGLVEMIKHGLIIDKNYFDWIEENVDSIIKLNESIIIEAIKRSVEIKSNIVAMDEKELGIRALLNFGHTFGHALELIGGYKDYNHGEAVALGILSASKLSQMTENLSEEEIGRIHSLFKKAAIGTKTIKEINPEDLYAAMQSDKKKQGKNLNFIVLEQIGKAKKVSNLKKEIVLEAIKNSLLPA
ncbi:MAG TPA: 3-dehydroquinate synthase [Gammaproteobacteria bacterium]|jgi:3-dehydroquinate synthase|nr:3-dehydroquinate synthase [Gammaproteobacteria bacterium]